MDVAVEVMEEVDDNESEQPDNTDNTASTDKAHAVAEPRRCAAAVGRARAGSPEDVCSGGVTGGQIAAAVSLAKLGGTAASSVRRVRSRSLRRERCVRVVFNRTGSVPSRYGIRWLGPCRWRSVRLVRTSS